MRGELAYHILCSLSFINLLTGEDLRMSEEYAITRLGNTNAENVIVGGTHLQVRRCVRRIVEVVATQIPRHVLRGCREGIVEQFALRSRATLMFGVRYAPAAPKAPGARTSVQ